MSLGQFEPEYREFIVDRNKLCIWGSPLQREVMQIDLDSCRNNSGYEDIMLMVKLDDQVVSQNSTERYSE